MAQVGPMAGVELNPAGHGRGVRALNTVFTFLDRVAPGGLG
jgi:hypothetical protein